MTLADNLEPEACIGVCSETIQRFVVGILGQQLEPDDTPEQQAEKLVILGTYFRGIREYTKEALKSVQMGQDYAASLLLNAREHKTLDQFPEITSVSITGPDGIEHQIDPKTALENLDRAEEILRKEGA